LLPGSVHFEQTEGFPVAPVERYPPQWHLAAATDSPATQQQFLTVLLPYREGGEARLPSVRLVEGRGCRCVEIRSAGARHVVLFRQGDQPGSMEAAGAISSANVLAAGFDPQGRTLGRLEE
jgi:hypothetical protein